MTCTMLRGHSGLLLLGRHLLPTSSSVPAASAKSSSYRLCSIATHSSSRTGWKPLQRISIAPANAAAPILRGRSNPASAASASFACSRGQFGRAVFCLVAMRPLRVAAEMGVGLGLGTGLAEEEEVELVEEAVVEQETKGDGESGLGISVYSTQTQFSQRP